MIILKGVYIEINLNKEAGFISLISKELE